MATFTDAFTGTAGQDLEARTGWTLDSGAAGACDISASGTTLDFDSTTESCYKAPSAGTGDHYAQVDILFSALTNSFFPLCINVQDVNNFIGFRTFNGGSGNFAQLFKRVGSPGSYTQIDTDATSGAATYRLSRSGNDLTVLRNGSAYMAASTSDLASVQTPGIITRNQTQAAALDNWESLEADSGGYTLTADPGAVSITGTAATLRKTFLLIASAGSVSITGLAASLEHARKLTADPGAVSISGVDVVFRRDYVLTADPGAVNITGTDADLVYISGYVLDAEAGAVSITGTDVIFRRDYVLSCSPGLVFINGIDANLIYSGAPPTVGGSGGPFNRRRRR